jgi:hypothetical protein
MVAAVYNTQPGYRPPRTPGMVAPRPATGLTRALSGVGGSYVNPFDTTQKTNDLMTGLAAGPIAPPTLPTVQSQAPAGTPTQYTPQNPVVPQAPTGYQFDLTTDPILQQISAAADKARADANAAALAQQKQLAIQYGDQAYGNTIDASTGQAAQQNPYSVYANLASQYASGQHNLNENLNAHNLFYSGERIRELAQALNDYQQQQAQAAGAEQQGLGNINANQIAALMGADQSVQQGYNDAYSRALAWALANGGTTQQGPVSATYGQALSGGQTSPGYVTASNPQGYFIGGPGQVAPPVFGPTPTLPTQLAPLPKTQPGFR